MLSRRAFLQGGAAGVSFLTMATRTPRLLVRAAEASAKADRNDHALVVLEMSGGNDGLNTLVPFEDPLYYKLRPTLALPKKEVLKLTDACGLHPRMEKLVTKFKRGQLAIVQGIGYPEPDRSHFRSMEIWHTASTAVQVPPAGWLGRTLDAMPAPEAGKLPALSLTGSLPQALRAMKASVPDVDQLEAVAASTGDEDPRAAMVRKLSATSGGSAPVLFVADQARTMYRAAEQLKAASEKYRSTVEYPVSELGGRLKRAAQLLAADVGVRVLYVSQDGYDTHATQADQHDQLLEDLSTSLAAFLDDLEQQKIADKVLVLAFSEFGRRVDENASRGTDHGAASCLFLAGEPVHGGLYGKYPSLDKLGDGDLIYNTDFRSVYATLLDNWLGCPAAPLLGDKYPHLDLV